MMCLAGFRVAPGAFSRAALLPAMTVHAEPMAHAAIDPCLSARTLVTDVAGNRGGVGFVRKTHRPVDLRGGGFRCCGRGADQQTG